jgi:2-methylfumaryl-CoA isomerase
MSATAGEGTSGGSPAAGAGGPLEDLHILDLSTYVAGPSGAMSLAQLGAEVIRIDPIGGATDVRRLPVDDKGNSLYWAGLNKGKRSVEIDTRSAEGRDLVERLIAASGSGGGIVLTNAVGQAWLSYEHLSSVRPDLIMVHIAGRADGRPAVDYTVNCEVGLPYITGPADFQRPVNHVLPAWDLLTGLHAAVAILAAERTRARTGRGGLLRVALSDVAVSTMAHLGFVADVTVNGRGRLREGNYLYGSFGCDFRTADGDRVMVVALTERHWHRLVELTGTGEAISALERSLGVDLQDEEARYRYREVLAALIAPWFEEHGSEEVRAGLEASQVLWGPYRTVEQLVRDADSLMAASRLFSDVHHAGIGTFPTPRSVLEGTGVPKYPLPAPALGADTDPVLRELLGLDGATLDDLRTRRVIGGPRR